MDVFDTLFRLGFTLFGEQIARALKDHTPGKKKYAFILKLHAFAIQNPELYSSVLSALFRVCAF